MPTTTKRRRRRGNKSAAIREYLKDNPTAGPSQVVAAMAEKNMKVTPTLVSNVKSRMLNGTAPAAKTGRRGRPAKRANGEASFPMSLLLEAKRLAEQAGSVDAAREALNAISKLR
jgi:hypothetical protein